MQADFTLGAYAFYICYNNKWNCLQPNFIFMKIELRIPWQNINKVFEKHLLFVPRKDSLLVWLTYIF